VVASEDASDYVHLWHQCLSHMSEKWLKVLVDRKSLPSLKFMNLNFCKYCVFGKKCRQKFKAGRNISKGILDYIHLDVLGPSPIVSLGGLSYFVTFLDDYSRKVWVYLLKRKVDVFNTFKQFRALVEKSTDRSIKCLRIDNGCEFTSMEFENYCKKARIKRHKTTVYTSQQNGVVERMNMTLLERARSMLSNAKMQQGLWEEVVLTSSYLINRSPSTAINCKIP
jgi:transposase InsO family protein